MKTNNFTNLIKSNDISFIVTCFRLELENGKRFAFTTNQFDINFLDDPFLTYKSNAVSNTAYSQKNNTSADNIDASILIDSNDITVEDLERGYFNNATIYMFDYDLRMNKFYSNTNPRSKGYVGQVTRKSNVYEFELRGIIENLKTNTNVTFIATCMNKFGDARCKKNIEQYTHVGVITSMSSYSNFETDISQIDDYFNGGELEFLSGECRGIVTPIKTNKLIEIFLRQPTVYKYKVGDQIRMIKGCSKTIHTCADDYENARNFNGFPFSIQTDALVSGEY